jgi:hypothetical protein
MSIVAVHGPSTWGDDLDQGNDNLAFAQTAVEVGTAFNATTTSTGTAAQAITATATGQAFQPERVTAY